MAGTLPRGSMEKASLADRWEILRKYYLALPFRWLRNLSRRVRKGQGVICLRRRGSDSLVRVRNALKLLAAKILILAPSERIYLGRIPFRTEGCLYRASSDIGMGSGGRGMSVAVGDALDSWPGGPSREASGAIDVRAEGP